MASITNIRNMTGVDRAAILLLTIGENDAAEILKHMGPKEVQKIGTAMAGMTNVSKDMVGAVMGKFISTVENETSVGVGSDEYIRNVLNNALGQDKASTIIDRILLGKNSRGLDALKWMEPRQVSELIKLEHPQIIAIILSYLDNDQSSAVLSLFDERLRVDVIMRIAALDGIQPVALAELNDIMEKQFAGESGNLKSSTVGGIKIAADILNFMEGGMDTEVLAKIAESNEHISQQIQDNMFVFDNLLEVDDRDIQMILREVSTEPLILALKGSDDQMREKVFKNMSKRAAEMLRDDLDAQGPVKLSEVETAQKEIIAVARRLSDAGEIALGGSEEYVT